MLRRSSAFLTCVAILAFVDNGFAADLPIAPAAPPAGSLPIDWSSFYFGAEGGGGFGTSKKMFSNGETTTEFGVKGAIGGGTVGFNQQWGNLVGSLEGDFSWSGVGGGVHCPNTAFTCGTKINWFATARPRAGYSFGVLMPYITGGLVVADLNVHSFVNATGAGNGVDFTKVEIGWTAGAGLEMSIGSNWSLKAEYLYVKLADTNGPSDRPGVTTATNFYENIIRGGVNYSFK